jgi:hypothetical protein
VADVDRIAVVLNRLAISLILTPSPVLSPMPTDKAAKKLARELLVPMIPARRSEAKDPSMTGESRSAATRVGRNSALHTAEPPRVGPRGLQRVRYSGRRNRSRFWTDAQVIGCFSERLRDVRGLLRAEGALGQLRRHGVRIDHPACRGELGACRVRHLGLTAGTRTCGSCSSQIPGTLAGHYRARFRFRQDPPSLSIRDASCACTGGGSRWSRCAIAPLSRPDPVAAGLQSSGSGPGR